MAMKKHVQYIAFPCSPYSKNERHISEPLQEYQIWTPCLTLHCPVMQLGKTLGLTKVPITESEESVQVRKNLPKGGGGGAEPRKHAILPRNNDSFSEASYFFSTKFFTVWSFSGRKSGTYYLKTSFFGMFAKLNFNFNYNFNLS